MSTTFYAYARPKGRNVHIVEAMLVVQDSLQIQGKRRQFNAALCGMVPGYHWEPIEKRLVDDEQSYHKKCATCVKVNAERTAAPEEPSSVVYCAYCGKPSDRGFIRACRACSGMNG